MEQNLSSSPKIAPEIPQKGFDDITKGVFEEPADDYHARSVEVIINKDSDRLQKLEPFPKWDRKDFEKLPVLAKVKGKCTTDHISPAGAWLMYRGHLDKISDNLLLGASNAYHNGEVGTGRNVLNRNIESFPHIAREYKKQGLKWVIIGDQNYGEGSSREHAAMTPRYLGCAAVISRSLLEYTKLISRNKGY